MLNKLVLDKMEMQLDIRSILKMNLDVRLLTKRTMTKDQRKLFALQRDRLPLVEDEDSYDSDLNADQDILHLPEAIKEVKKMIDNYKIETGLDRKLLLGVLQRDCHHHWAQVQQQQTKNTINSTYLERSGAEYTQSFSRETYQPQP